MGLDIGQEAPDFALKDEHGQMVRLSDFRGEKNVAVVFYPFAFSGTCTGELCEIRDNLAVFEADNVQVLAVSCDAVWSLRIWAESQKFAFPLLSDFWPHGAVAQAYGVFNEQAGVANRGTFVIDKEGVVRYAHMQGPGEPRDQKTWRETLAEILI